MTPRHIVAIGGSDAGISAALRARELDPTTDVTVVVADAYPNFSICGIPYYVSGEVTHWTNLAHRTAADLAATGMRVLTDTRATGINVEEHTLDVLDPTGAPQQLSYDALIVGTGAISARPPIRGLSGPDALGPADGVHLLHSMGDTFAVMDSLQQRDPATAVIVGAGYIGLEMAEALTTRGIRVTQIEALPEVLPTVDPELGALVHAELERHGVEVLTNTAVTAITRTDTGALTVTASHDGQFDLAHSRFRPRRGRSPPRHRTRRRRRRPTSASKAPSLSTKPCAPTCPTSSPPATACTPTTGSSASPGCRWAPPLTNKAGWPARTRSAATPTSRAAWAPKSSRSSTSSPPAPASANTKPSPRTSAGHPSPANRVPTTTRPTTQAPHRIHIRITGDQHSGRLLGAQLVGHRSAEIAKRVDTYATALFHEMTVDSLSELDLSYTPPLGSPWDATQMAAQAWVREHQPATARPLTA